MDILILISRILYGGVFVVLALGNFVKLDEKTALAKSKKVPAARLSVIAASTLAILGGLSIVLGYQIQIGVTFLVMFLIPASLMIHNFWSVEDPVAKQIDMINFLKNMALIGAALMFLALPQPWGVSLGG